MLLGVMVIVALQKEEAIGHGEDAKRTHGDGIMETIQDRDGNKKLSFEPLVPIGARH
jgi:hypothetical protein